MAAQTQAPESPKTVNVACKLPNGLILHLDKLEEVTETVPGGSRTVKRAVPLPERVTINGTAIKRGEMPAFVIKGGYAITQNVDGEFWDEWLKQNAESDLVKNKLIFAHGSAQHVAGQANELKDLKSGLQPLKPGERGTDGRIDAISPTTEITKADAA